MNLHTVYTVVAIIYAFLFSVCANADIFIDNCDSTANTLEKVYENFDTTTQVSEIFSICQGKIPNCIFSPVPHRVPKVNYFILGAEKITVEVISATSNVASKNSVGEILLGFPNKDCEAINNRVCVDKSGVAVICGKALAFSDKYVFSKPFDCNLKAHLGPNLTVEMEENDSKKSVEMTCVCVTPIKRSVGGYAYLEKYSASVPKDAMVISLSLVDFSQIWNGKSFQNSNIRYQTAISSVQIEGKKLETIKTIINSPKPNKTNSKPNSDTSKKFDADVSIELSEKENSSPSSVVVYDNDTVIQNFSSGKDTGEPQSDILAASNFEDGDTLSELVNSSSDSTLVASEGEDKTWKLAGGLYLALGVGVLLFALLRKKSN